MSGNALNFKVSVDAKQVNDLNTSLTALRENFIGLDTDAKKSTAGVDKALKGFNSTISSNAKSTQQAFSANKKFYELIRMQVRTVDSAQKKIKALEAAKSKLNTTDKHYQTNLKAINAELAKTNQYIFKNAILTQKSTAATRNASAALSNQNRALDKQGAFFSRNTSLAQQFQNQMIGLTSIYAMERMLSTLIKVRGEFEIQNVALTAMLQNKALADKMFLEVQDLALQSPFKILDLNKSLKQLKAYRIENENLVDTLGMLGDISAGLGVGMDRLILAFGQIKATGWLRGTELRQLTEAGINILDPLVQKFKEMGEVGVTTADVMKKVEQRMISFGMVNEVFDDLTKKGGIFYEQQILQSTTLQGKVSILTDALHKMLNEFGQTNEGMLKGGVDALISLISNFDKLKDILGSLLVTFGAYRVAMFALNGGHVAMIKNFNTMTASVAKHRLGVKRLILSEKRLELSKKNLILAEKELNLVRRSGLATSAQMAMAQKNQVVATKQVAAAQKAAAASTKALKMAMGALMIALEVVALIVIKLVHDKRELIKQAQEYTEGTKSEIQALRELQDILGSATSTLKERNKALKDAIDMNPDIIGNLNAEGRATDELTDSIDLQITALKERARIQAMYGAEYLKSAEEQEEAQTKADKNAAEADKELQGLLKNVESLQGTEGLTKNLYKIYFDESLDVGEKLIKLTRTINKELQETKPSKALVDALDEVGKVSRGGTFSFDKGGAFRGVGSSRQSGIEAQFVKEAKVQEIFESFEMAAKGAAYDAGALGSEAFAQAFADNFGAMAESDVLFGKDVVEHISSRIFPANWKADQESMIQEYFDFFEMNVEKGSAEWQSALDSDSRAKSFSLNKFLLEEYGIGDPETLRKETRVWARTVKGMIADAQSDILDFREDETGTGLGVSQPVMTQNIEAYREYIAGVVDDTETKIKGLPLAAQNDPKIQKELNKLYKERLKTFQEIKKYLGVVDGSGSKRKFEFKEYARGLDNLLNALKKFKTETSKFAKELDYTLALPEGTDFLTSKALLFDSVNQTFADTFFKSVYDSFEEGSGDYSKMVTIADGITKDISKIFTDSLTGESSKSDVEAAVRSYYDEIFNGLGTKGLSSKDLEKFKAQLESTKKPIIDAIFGDPISNKEYDKLVEDRDKMLGKFEGNDAFTGAQKQLTDILTFDEDIVSQIKETQVDALKLREDYINATPDKQLEMEKAITKEVEDQKDAYLDIKEKLVPGMAKKFVDDAFGLQNLTQGNLSESSLTKLVSMSKELKNMANTDWNFGKLLKLEGEDLEHFNTLNQQIKETLSLSGEDWSFTDALGVMTGELSTLSDEQNELYDTYSGIAENLTDEQLDLIKQLFEKLKVLEAQAKKDVRYEIIDELADIGSEIGTSFSKVNDDLMKMIGEFVSTTSKAIGDIVNGEGIEKASGIVSLIMAVGNEIQGVWSDLKTEAVDAQMEKNKGLASQLKMESKVNELVRERVELEREASAFYDPTSVQNVQFYSDQAKIAREELDNAMETLQGNAVFSADGVGDKEFFGFDVGDKEENHSFTMADMLGTSGNTYDSAPVQSYGNIVQDIENLSNMGDMDIEDIAASFLDPLGIFGGGSSGRAQTDAFKQTSEAFNAALTSMGKTASDMAVFSSEDWLDFYKIIEEGGHITDESTLAMIESGTEALDAYNEAMEGLRQTIEDLAGTIYTDLKGSLTQAFIDGTYAADDFRDALSGILEEMISATIFQATFGKLFDELQAGLEQTMLTNDPADDLALMQGFFEDANSLAPKYDAMLSNAAIMADQFNFELFKDSVDELGELQSGIQGMSEDTASVLVGQFNSIRDAVWRIYGSMAANSDTSNLNTAISEGLMHLAEIRMNTLNTATATAGTLALLQQLSTTGSGKKLNI